MTDEELMERVNVAVSAETERQNKMAAIKKGAQVNQVVTNQEPGWASQNSSEDPANKKKSTKSKKKLTDEDKDKLTATLESVQTDLASLKEAFNRSQQSQGELIMDHQAVDKSKGKFNVIHVNSLVNRYVTIALSVDQVNTLQEGVRRAKETGNGYDQGTGSSP